MSISHQDLKYYKEISSEEEKIIRRHVSFSLSDMIFNDQSEEGKPTVSDLGLGTTEHRYQSDCLSAVFSYNKDPNNLVDDLEERDKLAYEVASKYMKAKYNRTRILDLEVSNVSVRFGGGNKLRKYFSLNLDADVVLEDMIAAN